jgi:hypothetical protein
VEARILEHYPDIRNAVLNSPAFAEWFGRLTAVEVDGETLYLRGGDMLRDKEQLIFEWARKAGLLTDESILRVQGGRGEGSSGRKP